MAVTIKNMDMPAKCHKCRFFGYKGILCSTPPMHLNAERGLLNEHIGRDITKSHHYPYVDGKHAIAEGERWKDCPLEEDDERMEDDDRLLTSFWKMQKKKLLNIVNMCSQVH